MQRNGACLAGVLRATVDSIRGVRFSVLFDVVEGVRGVESCGLLVVGDVHMSHIYAAFKRAGVNHVLTRNCLAMTVDELSRRVAALDPFILQVLGDKSRCVHPVAASHILDEVTSRARICHHTGGPLSDALQDGSREQRGLPTGVRRYRGATS